MGTKEVAMLRVLLPLLTLYLAVPPSLGAAPKPPPAEAESIFDVDHNGVCDGRDWRRMQRDLKLLLCEGLATVASQNGYPKATSDYLLENLERYYKSADREGQKREVAEIATFLILVSDEESDPPKRL